MRYALAALTAAGVVLTIFTGLPGLILAIPAAIALLLVLRAGQPETAVDQRYTGGAQPDMDVAAQVEKTPDDATS